MNINKYFSLQRFARLFRNDLLINQKTYLFAIAGLSLVIYAIALFSMRTNRNFSEDDYSVLFAFYLMGVGVIVGTAFPAFSNQIKTNHYLLTPGSTFEKFLIQFVFRIVIFIPMALIIFWISAHLAKASLVPDPQIGFDPAKTIADFHFNKLFEAPDKTQNRIIYLCIFSFGTVLFAGSAFFNRFALVKTLIVSAITCFTVFCSFVLFSHIFYPAETHGFDVRIKTYEISKNLYNTQLAAYVLGSLSWIFFLVLGYFKLKEKEI